MDKWFVLHNPNAGYIAAKKKREDEPIHSGNLDFCGPYAENEEEVTRLVQELNNERGEK